MNYWPQNHEDIILGFIKDYARPGGAGLDMKRIKYCEPEKLKVLNDAGRTNAAVNAKGRHLMHKAAKAKVERKAKAPVVASAATKRGIDPAWNFCPTCGHNI